MRKNNPRVYSSISSTKFTTHKPTPRNLGKYNCFGIKMDKKWEKLMISVNKIEWGNEEQYNVCVQHVHIDSYFPQQYSATQTDLRFDKIKAKIECNGW